MPDAAPPAAPLVQLVANWRQAHKMNSVRVAVLWTLVGAGYMALPGFASMLDPFWFAGLCVAFGLATLYARLTHQPGVD